MLPWDRRENDPRPVCNCYPHRPMEQPSRQPKRCATLTIRSYRRTWHPTIYCKTLLHYILRILE